MTAGGSERGGEGEVGVGDILVRTQLGLAQGEGAGLVEDHGVDLGQTFERRCRFQENSPSEQIAAGHHLHGRHGEAEGAGAGDDQHGDGIKKCCLPGSTGEERPAEKGSQRQAMNDRCVPAGDPVGQHHVTAAALLGEFHQADDLGKQRAFAHGRDAELDRRGHVDRAGKHPIAFVQRCRHRLAGDQAGVNLGAAADDPAIHPDAFASGDQHLHADRNLLRRHGPRPAIGADHRNRPLVEAEHAFCRLACLAACTPVQIAAEKKEEQQHGRRFEIDVRAAAHRLEQD